MRKAKKKLKQKTKNKLESEVVFETNGYKQTSSGDSSVVEVQVWNWNRNSNWKL